MGRAEREGAKGRCSMTPTVGYTKRALRRREGYPVGMPAPLFILCGCGRELDVSNPWSHDTVRCECGTVYDSEGWIQKHGIDKRYLQHPANPADAWHVCSSCLCQYRHDIEGGMVCKKCRLWGNMDANGNYLGE